MITILTTVFWTVETGISPLWALLTAVVGGLITYLTKKSTDKSNVKIAEIKSLSDKEKLNIELLRDEIKKLKEDYSRVKEKLEKAEEVNDKNEWLISEYSNMIKHYRFIFKLIYKQIVPKLVDDESSLILMEEVKEMFRDDFKL